MNGLVSTMENKLRRILFALPLSLMAGVAWSQDSATVTDNCANHLNTSRNPTVTALLGCLAEMQRTIDKLELSISAPRALSASDIAAVALELKKNHTEAIKGDQGAPGQDGKDSGIPSGAVVAFDLQNGCPVGWKADFAKGQGKFILGVGSGTLSYRGNHHRPDDVANVVALRDVLWNDQGGEEKHLLNLLEIPSHSHKHKDSTTSVLLDRHDFGADNANNSLGVYIQSKTRTSAVVGGNAPHNNMPPFIALHFCKKE